MDLNAILRRAVELGASDIHLKLDQPPMLRRDGSIAPLEECPPLNEQNLLGALETVTRVAPERLRRSTRAATSTSRTPPRACRASASTPSASAARSRSRSA